MKTTTLFLSLALAFSQVIAETADEVINKHINAMGGLQKLKAINTKKLSVSMENRGMQFSVTILHSRPNKMKTEVEIMGKKQITAFDGKEGWSINPFTGRETVEKMSQDDVKEMNVEADFDGPLVDYKTKGHSVVLEADEDIEGSSCYHLKLSTKDNKVINYYVDKDSYLMVMQKVKSKNEDGSEVESETAFSNYKEVNGIMLPFSLEQRGTYQGQKTVLPVKVSDYQLNVEIPDAQYAPPAGK